MELRDQHMGAFDGKDPVEKSTDGRCRGKYLLEHKKM